MVCREDTGPLPCQKPRLELPSLGKQAHPEIGLAITVSLQRPAVKIKWTLKIRLRGMGRLNPAATKPWIRRNVGGLGLAFLAPGSGPWPSAITLAIAQRMYPLPRRRHPWRAQLRVKMEFK